MGYSSIEKTIKKLNSQKNIEQIKNQLNDKEKIIETADLLIQNKFLFIRTWDMEPCPTPYEIKPLNWLANPNGDDEWTFMLNRFDYLEYLVMASIITEEENYLEHARYLILDWIENHPEINPSYSTRTLDTAMRIDSWFSTMIYLEKFDLLSTKDYQKIENSMIKQMIYMKDHYIPKYTLSNWGSIQTAVIIRVLPTLCDFDRKVDIYQWAIEEFETQMKLQVYDDGLHWEQSTMYHAEVMHYSLKLVHDPNYKMPKSIKDILYSMAKALLYQMTPTGSFEAFGDSDISNLVSLLNLVAVIFEDSKFKLADKKITNMDNLYEMTSQEIAIYRDLSSNLPKVLNFDGFDSGMFTTRSSWGKNANFTLFTNGTMGSGHAHSDNNHLSIYHQGKGIIVDSGRFTYREDDERRIQLKSAKAHSSVIIDEEPASLPNGSWTYERYLKPIANRVKHKESFHFYEGSTYSDLTETPSIHTRKVLLSDLGIWLVIDDLRTKGKHSMRSYFNIEPEVKIESTDRGLLLNNLKFVSFDEKVELYDYIYSPSYNQLENNKQIQLSSDFENQAIRTKLFIDKDYEYEKVTILRDKKEAISEDLGIAIKIKIADGHSITFAVIHDELYSGRKNLYCEGLCFHAKAVAIEEKNNKKEIYVLST